ncbi:glucosyltransferase domain-containing protein [Solibacillus merdavium]|uniref:glucosyltransferase domain-containing protein n=1 Tax=Solibacillus merdavium TaxID=2762218 RepID=UPI0017802084|nr:glucosyltransferase domain-containing protein [Solibacillus merdavium]
MDKKNITITERMKFTFIFSLSSTIIIHLFMLVNNLKNHDSLWHFYGDMDLSSSGRFTLKYLGSLSSYFDLHYLNLLISCIFLSLGLVLIIEIFNIVNKKNIIMFIVIYAAFPSVSGIFSYAFTADAYYISFFLTLLAIYISTKNIWYNIGAVFLLYVALGTYQANLTLAVTMVVVILIQRLMNNNNLDFKSFIKYIVTIVGGLLLYIIHFKIYQNKVGLTEYGGINDAGVINFETIYLAAQKAVNAFNIFIFNNYSFTNLFEKLNLLYILLVLITLLIFVLTSKIKFKNFTLIIMLIGLCPFYLYLIYFVSPSVFYHVLMLQNIPLMYLIGIFILETNIFKSEIIYKVINKVAIIILFLIAFNLVVITNIYYEKLSLINNYTNSLMTKVSYEIENIQRNSPLVDSLLVIGNPTTHINLVESYNTKVPYNVGIGNIVFNEYTTTLYLNNFLGHELKTMDIQSEFVEINAEEINEMSQWPLSDSIKVIDNTIIIRFE